MLGRVTTCAPFPLLLELFALLGVDACVERGCVVKWIGKVGVAKVLRDGGADPALQGKSLCCWSMNQTCRRLPDS